MTHLDLDYAAYPLSEVQDHPADDTSPIPQKTGLQAGWHLLAGGAGATGRTMVASSSHDARRAGLYVIRKATRRSLQVALPVQKLPLIPLTRFRAHKRWLQIAYVTGMVGSGCALYLLSS